jgi:hypothetical protein
VGIDKSAPSTDDGLETPVLLFERLAFRLGFRDALLFPLPFVVASVLFTLLTYYFVRIGYDGTSTLMWYPLTRGSDYLNYSLIWIALFGYALYSMLLYKVRYFQLLHHFKAINGIGNEFYENARMSFINRGYRRTLIRYIVILVLIEGGFYLWWGHYLSGLFIAVMVLPLGADIFSALISGTLLAIKLSEVATPNRQSASELDILDSDGRGGLRQIDDFLLTMAMIYFGGISISLIYFGGILYYISIGSYADLITSGKYLVYLPTGLGLVVFGIFIFLIPEIFVGNRLAREKRTQLGKIQSRLVTWETEVLDIDARDVVKQSAKLQSYESFVSNLRDLRDEINRVRVWPPFGHLLKLSLGAAVSLAGILTPQVVQIIVAFFNSGPRM